MEICIWGYANTRFWLRKDTGTMNRSPTPDGMFATNFVGVRNVIAIRQQHYRNLLAAVGADLSRPHIRIHPQNDKRICACNKMNAHI